MVSKIDIITGAVHLPSGFAYLKTDWEYKYEVDGKVMAARKCFFMDGQLMLIQFTPKLETLTNVETWINRNQNHAPESRLELTSKSSRIPVSPSYADPPVSLDTPVG